MFIECLSIVYRVVPAVASPHGSLVTSPHRSPHRSPVTSPHRSLHRSPRRSPVASPHCSLVASHGRAPEASHCRAPDNAIMAPAANRLWSKTGKRHAQIIKV